MQVHERVASRDRLVAIHRLGLEPFPLDPLLLLGPLPLDLLQLAHQLGRLVLRVVVAVVVVLARSRRLRRARPSARRRRRILVVRVVLVELGRLLEQLAPLRDLLIRVLGQRRRSGRGGSGVGLDLVLARLRPLLRPRQLEPQITPLDLVRRALVLGAELELGVAGDCLVSVDQPS